MQGLRAGGDSRRDDPHRREPGAVALPRRPDVAQTNRAPSRAGADRGGQMRLCLDWQAQKWRVDPPAPRSGYNRLGGRSYRAVEDWWAGTQAKGFSRKHLGNIGTVLTSIVRRAVTTGILSRNPAEAI